jgi:hypothetical protein
MGGHIPCGCTLAPGVNASCAPEAAAYGRNAQLRGGLAF